MSQQSRVTTGMTAERRRVALHDLDHEDDENEGDEGYIKGTDFSLPYMSPWSRLQLTQDAPADKKRVHRHLNCSYLSTPGDAPTLLALKQHAQSLCALIWEISPSLTVDEILGDGVLLKPGPAFKEADEGTARTLQRARTFDFLADLSTPYWSDDVNHHKQLWALHNEVSERGETTGTRYHCPLAKTEPRPVPALDEHGNVVPPREPPPDDITPWASHHNLIHYANLCLERLDHEFSAVGGLLGMLPPDGDSEQLAFAQNTLLGQWLRHMQTQQLRMKELEDAYGNALSILSGEAHAPMQHLSAQGPDGRSARELVYPQDRWVLVNSGDDVFEYVHDLLDAEEARHEEKEDVWLAQGLVGHRLKWRGGDEKTRGIVSATLQTRFYRLTGQGRGPVFVLPAWDHHPALEGARVQESKPKIVSSVEPKFPLRVSELESRYNKRIAAAARLELENSRLVNRQRSLEEQLGSLQGEIERLHVMHDGLVLHNGEDRAKLAHDLQKAKKAKAEADKLLARAKKEAEEAEQHAKDIHDKVLEEKGEAARFKQKLNKLRDEIAKLKPGDLDDIKKRVLTAKSEDDLPRPGRLALEHAHKKGKAKAAATVVFDDDKSSQLDEDNVMRRATAEAERYKREQANTPRSVRR